MQKNEVAIFKNPELNLQVRTILNPDGSISVNAEDTARGFGWTTVAKSGNEVVRWARINEYCKEIGFFQQVGRDDYLPESLFYRLGMKASNAVANKFQDCLAMDVIPTLRKTGAYEMPKERSKKKTEKLCSVNNAARTILPVLDQLGMRPIHKAYMLKQLYGRAGLEIPIEAQEEEQHLYDNTQIAERLGIFSTSGKPHNQAVAVIIKKLCLAEDDIVITSFEKNGHVGTTHQYKEVVVEGVARWLSENGYPDQIPFVDSKGTSKVYKVVYREVA